MNMLDIEKDWTARFGAIDAEMTTVLQGRTVTEVRETETHINIMLHNKSNRKELTTVIALPKPVKFTIDKVGYKLTDEAEKTVAGI